MDVVKVNATQITGNNGKQIGVSELLPSALNNHNHCEDHIRNILGIEGKREVNGV